MPLKSKPIPCPTTNPFVLQFQQMRKRINLELKEAVERGNHKQAFSLIKKGAVVDPEYAYAINLLGSQNLFIDLSRKR